MSSFKERKEKNCLNCNAETLGRFCHICGQENIDPRESFWSLSFHFIADIFHYEGKFFRTLKYLFTKPGFLAIEYLRGRRKEYLHPIRLYLFVSAVVFLILFTFYSGHKDDDHKPVNEYDNALAKIEKSKRLLYADYNYNYQNGMLTIKNSSDSAEVLDKEDSLKLNKLDSAIIFLKSNPTLTDSALLIADIQERSGFESIFLNYSQKAELEPDDNWYLRKRKLYILKKKQLAKATKTTVDEQILEDFWHTTPKVMFFILPVIALVLYVFYARKLRYSYVAQIIFTVYIFCFLFLAFFKYSIH